MSNDNIETIMDIFISKIKRAKEDAMKITDASVLKHDNMLGSDVAEAQQTETPVGGGYGGR